MIRGLYAFEAIDEGLPFMPLAARRVLDGLGLKLSLEAWRSLSIDDRRQLVGAGAAPRIDPAAHAVLARALPAPPGGAPQPEPDGEAPPSALVEALGRERPLDAARWRQLDALGRYALAKCASRPEKLALAYDEIVGARLSHLTATGEAHMVDVGGKGETARTAVATARVRSTRVAVEAIAAGTAAKGDVLAAARVAGILAAKRTSDLIPLCHPVRTTRAAVELDLDPERGEIHVRATVDAVDRTGVEMEAMVAASVASLTLYDMIKSVDRWAVVDSVRLDSKSGGKSGEVRRPPERGGR